MTNLDNVLKGRGITLLAKLCIIRAMASPVIMYRYESWIIKKAEHQRSDAFKLLCWRRLLRVPCTAKRSNQSMLKGITPEHSLEGLMMELQYFDHLRQRANSLEKTLIQGQIESRKRRGWQKMIWLVSITHSVDMSFSSNSGRWWRIGNLACCSPWGYKELDRTEWLTTTKHLFYDSNTIVKPSKNTEKMPLNFIW